MQHQTYQTFRKSRIMKTNKIDKKGELVYIPSQTFLSNRIGVKMTSQIQKVDEPGIFLILGEESGSYKILYKGRYWFVSKKDVYEVKGEDHDHQVQRSL